jgi:hypothetical protein
MATYRIFAVGRDQHFLGVSEIVECVDDNEAVDKPMQLANGLDLAIWDSRHMVARLPHSPPKVSTATARRGQIFPIFPTDRTFAAWGCGLYWRELN